MVAVVFVNNNDFGATVTTMVTFINDNDFGASASIMLSNVNSCHSSNHSTHHHGLACAATAAATRGHLNLRNELRPHVDSTSIEAHQLKLDLLVHVTLHRSQEEVKRNDSVADHVTSNHILVTYFDMDLSGRIHNDVLHAVKGAPFGVFATHHAYVTLPDLFVDSDCDLRRHSLEQSNVTKVQVSVVGVHL